MKLRHFIHNHPLTLTSSFDRSPYCWACDGEISDVAYGCQDCNFYYIHEWCAGLPTEIEHPLHPRHPLNLRYREFSECFECWACRDSLGYWYYTCSQCNFGLDVACCLLKPSRRQQIEHPQHDHPLVLCDTTAHFYRSCHFCSQPFEGGSAWVWLECHHLLHAPCLQFEQEVKHPFHPQHLLKLSDYETRPDRYWMCHACGQAAMGLDLTCSDCDFILHPKCAFLIPTTQPHDNPDSLIHHLNQNHPLLLCHMTNNFQLDCSACGHSFDASMSIYACLRCNVLLHQSCLEWPAAIKHPSHPLFLLSKLHGVPQINRMRGVLQINRTDCGVCRDSIIGCTYHCVSHDCGFSLHLKCASVLPTIDSKLHQLFFFRSQKRDFFTNCHACDTNTGTFFLRCVHNDFNYHFRCYPTILPNTIKHECHRHPLLLTTSPVKDYPDEDDDAEFICDACEGQRKLDEITYYCTQCHYVAHVDCALSELCDAMEKDMLLVCIPGVALPIDVIKRKIWALHIDTGLSEKVGNKDAANSTLVAINEDIDVLRETIEAKKTQIEALMVKLEKLQKKCAQIDDIQGSTEKHSFILDLSLDCKLDVKHADIEYSSIKDLMVDLRIGGVGLE